MAWCSVKAQGQLYLYVVLCAAKLVEKTADIERLMHSRGRLLSPSNQTTNRETEGTLYFCM
jgi:hypothetical protein